MHPLLAHIYEPHRVTFPCYVQPKLNGIRALYQNGHFQSRGLEPFSPAVLAHLSRPLKETFGPEVILDGELYVHGWPLQRINGAVTPVRLEPTEDTLRVEYHVFDTVDFTLPFISRRYTFSFDQIKEVRTIHCGTASLANELYAQFVSEGYEGMMYRLGDCPYTVPKQLRGMAAEDRSWNLPFNTSRFLSDKDNRVWHLLKRKDWQDHEFPFLSLNTTIGEKGERGFQMHLFSTTGHPFKVSSGLSTSQLDFYLEHPPIGQLIKVKYLCLSSDGIPLNATIHPDHLVK